LAPDVEKHVAQEIFGQRLVVHDTQQPAVYRHAMPREQRSHRELIAAGDPPDQRFVR
jgi:hypothetical protein